VDDDRRAERRLDQRHHRRRVRRVLHRLDARSEHEHRLRRAVLGVPHPGGTAGLAYFAGWKFVVVALWLPIAVALSAVFHPTLDPTALEIVVFIFAIWGAYLVRSMFQGTIGMLNFWTTRGAAVFDLYMAVEMLLSGRLVPLQLMPEWVQTLANFLPFKWTFGFPIESLVGDLSTQELLLGLAAQALWIGIGLLLFKVAWSFAIKRFVSVGN
jgi:ABC-2 type transport system permease protein